VYLILGYLGFGNYGDELLADLLESRLKAKHGSNTEIKRLSAKKSWLKQLNLLIKSQKVFAIGGMFQDLSGPWSIYYYSLVIIIAKLLSKEIIIFAQGIGPLQNPFTKFITRLVFSMASKISVRDDASSEFLQESNIPHITVTDWAWILLDEIENIDIKKFTYLPKNSICVALRESRFINEDFLQTISSLINSQNKNIIFLAMQDGDQSINMICKNLLESSNGVTFIDASKFSPQELIYLFKNYISQIYTMRYHAGLIAKIAGIEVNLIDCDPKMVHLSKQISSKPVEELFLNAKLSEEFL